MAKQLFNFYITTKQKRRLKKEARAKGSTLSEIMRRIIDSWMEEKEKEEEEKNNG